MPSAQPRDRLASQRLRDQIRGSVGYALAALILAVYVVTALAPFRPRPRYNHAVVLASGGVQFPGPGLLRSASAPGWLRRAIERDQLKVELRIKSSSPEQYGPARVFTISQDTLERNLTVGQDGADLVVRLRTPSTGPNGVPPYTIPDVFRTPEWQTVTVSVRGGALAIALNEEDVLVQQLPEAPMTSWDPQYRVALGNELTGDRPWVGEIRRATVWVEEQEIDYTEGADLDRPSWYLPDCKVEFIPTLSTIAHGPGRLRDVALNFLCFIPLGYLLMVARGQRGSLLFPVFVCAGASLCVEVVQIFIETRNPSGLDVVLNTWGGAAGAWVARHRVRGSAGRQGGLFGTPRVPATDLPTH